MFGFQLQEILEGARGDPSNPLSTKNQGLFFWLLCHSLSAKDKYVCTWAHLPQDPRGRYVPPESLQESWGPLDRKDTQYTH